MRTSTIAAGDNSRFPSENELAMARFQRRHTARIARRLTWVYDELCR